MLIITDNFNISKFANVRISKNDVITMLENRVVGEVVFSVKDPVAAQALTTLLGIKCPVSNKNEVTLGRGDVVVPFVLKGNLSKTDAADERKVEQVGYQFSTFEMNNGVGNVWDE